MISGRLSNHSPAPSFLGQKPVQALQTGCGAQGRETSRSTQGKQVRGQSAGPQAPRTLDDGDRDGDPERAQSRALQLTRVCGVSHRAALNSQHKAPGAWPAD